MLTDHLGWLTPAELDGLGQELLGLLARYRRQDPAERPAGTRRVAFFAYGLPTESPPGTPSKDGDAGAPAPPAVRP